MKVKALWAAWYAHRSYDKEVAALQPKSSTSSAWAWVGGIVAVVFIIWLIVFVIDWIGARATPQAGQIGVVRSGPDGAWVGSWFNGRGIRSIVAPGSGSTYVGLGSEVHWYPADTVQRYYTITSDASRGDRPGVDVVEVPTSDGVRVGLEGTFYFTTSFNASKNGQKLLKDFDNSFGVRTFPVAGSPGSERHAWDGTDGWEAFLDSSVRPIIDNDLRRSVAGVSCADLVSSCALVHQQTVSAIRNGGAGNTLAISRIQDQINASLQSDVRATLGEDYFSGVRFLLAKVALPGAIQGQIDQAQAQFAAVGSAQAGVQQARLQAQANRERQAGYQQCPACASIDELKSIPSNVTTFAPGGSFAITQPNK